MRRTTAGHKESSKGPNATFDRHDGDDTTFTAAWGMWFYNGGSYGM